MKQKAQGNEAGLTKAQLEQLRGVLEEARAAVVARRLARVAAVTSPHTDVMDEGDVAARDDAERTLMSLAESERLQLERIDGALRRLHHPQFGLDVDTG